MTGTFCCRVGILLLVSVSPTLAEPKDGHERAAAAIEDLGGYVRVVKPKVGEPETHVLLLEQGYVGYWKGGDAGLAHLQDLNNVTTLTIRDAHLSDGGLKHLQRLTNLRVPCRSTLQRSPTPAWACSYRN